MPWFAVKVLMLLHVSLDIGVHSCNMVIDVDIHTTYINTSGEVIIILDELWQELMSGEAAKERVTSVPSKS